MSPAQKAGMKIGKRYYVERGGDQGQWVTFIEDDGSNLPRFRMTTGEEYYEFLGYLDLAKKDDKADIRLQLETIKQQINQLLETMD
jgi:hypothetical protein